MHLPHQFGNICAILTPLFLSYFSLIQHEVYTLACRDDPILVFQAQGSYTLHQSCPFLTPHAPSKQERKSSTPRCQSNDPFGVAYWRQDLHCTLASHRQAWQQHGQHLQLHATCQHRYVSCAVAHVWAAQDHCHRCYTTAVATAAPARSGLICAAKSRRAQPEARAPSLKGPAMVNTVNVSCSSDTDAALGLATADKQRAGLVGTRLIHAILSQTAVRRVLLELMPLFQLLVATRLRALLLRCRNLHHRYSVCCHVLLFLVWGKSCPVCAC